MTARRETRQMIAAESVIQRKLPVRAYYRGVSEDVGFEHKTAYRVHANIVREDPY